MTKRRMAVVVGGLVLVLLLVYFGFQGSSSPAPLAVLEAKVGGVDRDHSRQVEAWTVAPSGANFFVGDGLRTLGDGRAELRLDDGSQLSLKSDTLIRFLDRAPGRSALGFDVQTGEATVEVGQLGFTFETSLGVARIEPGSRVSVRPTEGGLKFQVEVGQAVFGPSETLNAGGEVQIHADGSITLIELGEGRSAWSSDVSPHSNPPRVAEKIQAVVKGERVKWRDGQSQDAAWISLEPGKSELSEGTHLELGPKDRVTLARGGSRATLQGAGRYEVAPRKGILVASSQGHVVAGGTKLVRVSVPGGTIVVAPSGRTSIVTGEEETEVKVLFHDAVVEHNDRRESLHAGQGASLVATGEVSLRGIGLDRADLDLPAGESWVVHDPAPPSLVRFLYPSLCSAHAVVELLGGKAREVYAAGAERVALSIPRGKFDYRVRCLEPDGSRGKVRNKGTISVLRDAGTRGLPARAPVSQLVADGREYTVLYQNRLPVIDLQWPGAPASKPVELERQFRGKSERIPLPGPSHKFSSGQLKEGQHVFFFRGDGKISRRTTVNIRFDNASPTGSLNSSGHIAAKPGERVNISGISLPGSKVLVNGRAPRLDRQGRFSSSASFPKNGGALAVSIRHPRRGNHVYLRRMSSP